MGDAVSEKFFTVSVSEVVRVNAPLVPVTVMVYVPPATVTGVTNVKVVLPDPVTVVGLKLAVAFVGRPDTAKLVAVLRPGLAACVIVAVPLAPAAVAVTLPELLRANPLETTRVIGIDCTRLPFVPVTLKL